jgi:dTDP-4-amino-4,6-dideoxygalactose transaminase
MRKTKIEFYKHNISDTDIRACINVLKSYFLTTGEIVKNFESKFASFLGVKYVVGVNSCTDALQLSLVGLGVQKGDEVIVPALSFIATANVVEYVGAKPVFVDVEKATGNIDLKLVEKAISKNTKAVILVHMYGQMCDMRYAKRLAKKYKIKLIEDSAHCIEGERDGVRPAQLSDAACFSFYATKNITSGEGGAVATNNKKLYNWLLSGRQHGMSKSAAERYSKHYEHYNMDFLGYKMNMTNIQASLLLHQLDNIYTFLAKKERIAALYNKNFSQNPSIDLPSVLQNTRHARHIYTLWVNPTKRDLYMRQIQEKNIGVAVNFRPIHQMKYYVKKYHYKGGSFPNAEYIGRRTITIPLYPKLTQEEIQYITSELNSIIRD